jgi:hypothetical protein
LRQIARLAILHPCDGQIPGGYGDFGSQTISIGNSASQVNFDKLDWMFLGQVADEKFPVLTVVT